MQFSKEKVCISIQISQKIVSYGPVDNKWVLCQLIAWHGTGNKPLSEPLLTQFTDAHMRHYKGRRVNIIPLLGEQFEHAHHGVVRMNMWSMTDPSPPSPQPHCYKFKIINYGILQAASSNDEWSTRFHFLSILAVDRLFVSDLLSVCQHLVPNNGGL